MNQRYEKAKAIVAAGAVEAIDGIVYRVYGNRPIPYTVDAVQGCCSCPDHQYREMICKHILSVELYEALRRAHRLVRRRVGWVEYSPAQIEANLARMAS